MPKTSFIKGKAVDDNTRCIHWHSSLDVIALKLKCCGQYHCCISCHDELAFHAVQRYNIDEEPDRKVIVCGCCKHEMSFQEYKSCDRDSTFACAQCKAPFNPGCKLHYHLYFDYDDSNKNGFTK